MITTRARCLRATITAYHSTRRFTHTHKAEATGHTTTFTPPSPYISAPSQQPAHRLPADGKTDKKSVFDIESTFAGATDNNIGDADANIGNDHYQHRHHHHQQQQQRSQHNSDQRDSKRHKRDPVVDEILRVDHAGEYGAQLIYAGQLDALRLRHSLFGESDTGLGASQSTIKLIAEMRDQEIDHLRAIEAMMPARRVRPTSLLPAWHVAGYALGYATAMMGTRAAMACTVAVEEVITDHYNDQLRTLASSDRHRHDDELRKMIKKHRDDEDHHRQIGIDNEAEQTVLYQPLTAAIRAGCQLAIAIARRV